MAKTPYITPIGIAKYPHIIEKDTVGNYANGKYTTKLVMSPEDAKPLIALLKAAQAKHDFGKDAKLPVTDETIKDGDNKKKTGNLQFSFSSKFPPTVVSPDNKPIKVGKLNDSFTIGGGSKIRIAGELYAYDKGISLQMHQVQIIDLVAGRASMFDAVDGSFDQSEFEDTEGAGAFTEEADSGLGL